MNYDYVLVLLLITKVCFSLFSYLLVGNILQGQQEKFAKDLHTLAKESPYNSMKFEYLINDIRTYVAEVGRVVGMCVVSMCVVSMCVVSMSVVSMSVVSMCVVSMCVVSMCVVGMCVVSMCVVGMCILACVVFCKVWLYQEFNSFTSLNFLY